jgi:hypothetical protein
MEIWSNIILFYYICLHKAIKYHFIKMIGAASKVNIDAIAFLKHASTRLKQDIDAIGNREHSSIGMLVEMQN